MDKEDIEKIYQRIARLLKKAESNKRAGPEYEQEATTAAFLAMQMMNKHKIDQSDISDFLNREEAGKDGPMGSEEVRPGDYGIKSERFRVTWQAMLAQMVAENTSCGVLNTNGSNIMTFYGRENDRKAAIYIWTFLVRETVRRTDAYIADFKKRGKMRVILNGQIAYRKANPKELQVMRGSFISGFVSELEQRIKEHRRKTVMNSQNPRALQILDDSLNEAVKYMQEHARYTTNTAFTLGDFASTMLDGMNEARTVNIAPAVENGVTDKSHQLTGAK